ncbi:MAG TPA: hypothetical protein VNS79_05340 [Sphingobium sp.]|nr:hypothetical protein [Sphingobium sp.]
MSPAPSGPTDVTVEQPPAKPVDKPVTDAGGKRPVKLGINIDMPTYYGGIRAFSNLILQSPWWLQTINGSVTLPAAMLDANQNIKKLDAGQRVVRAIGPPTRALRGLSVDVVCRWSGTATVTLGGVPAKNPRIGKNSATFTFVPGGENRVQFLITSTDNADPIRDIDCREADANPDAVFDPDFVENVARYNNVRFMKWQTAVEANTPIRWADRSRPTSNAYISTTDGVPVEDMVLLANQAKTDPWFCMPWNADDDYIRKFAEYVRDHLDPSLVAYVETSNEVWNWTYKVTTQARDEGRARGMDNGDGGTLFYRYAERTGEVMDIWSAVFAGQLNRLVRVAATQNAVPWSTGRILSFKDTASKIDAIATAPYFEWSFKAGEKPPADFFSTVLPGQLDLRMKNAAENKERAAAKGLRFITYEAGQHITIGDWADVPMLTAIQRDPRMGDLYTRYLTKWKDEFGDLMVLYVGWGPVSVYGAWGMQEYMGQPLNEAPKAQAVDLFRRSYVTKN